MNMCSLKKKKNCISNKGMTLIEMIVSFALLAIFLASAAAIIGTITSMYFEIKGENYSRQVSDIVMEKVESEIDGSKYKVGNDKENLRILSTATSDSNDSEEKGRALILTDKTNTKIKLYSDPDSKELIIHYYPIGDSYEATDWKFDKSVYNHFSIEELYFIRGDKIGDDSVGIDISEYGLEGISAGTYGKEIVGVFLKIHSSRYGDYYSYRLVKMYNYSE